LILTYRYPAFSTETQSIFTHSIRKQTDKFFRFVVSSVEMKQKVAYLQNLV